MLDSIVVSHMDHTIEVPKFLVPLFKESTGRDLDLEEIKYDIEMCLILNNPDNLEVSNEDLNSRVLYTITKEIEDIRTGLISDDVLALAWAEVLSQGTF